jgi:hypothetical protein
VIQTDLILPQKEIYNFLRSVTIKYDPIAQYLNNALIKKGHVVNQLDPTSWKYYQNMVGQYHSSDTLMYVTSLDTRQRILFSTGVLVDHPRTKAAYKPGGAYYKKLCETYPDQVDLIKSILFPVSDVNAAIDADNFTMLAYGEGYLEAEEEPIIIMEIEKFLAIFVERWYFDFLDDEAYFYITAWGTIWTHLAMLIMSTRISLIRTPYVHSWHIWNQLQDRGIDNYSDILDRKKSMMLYQNIDYLKVNAGKQSNLIILANRLLSDIGIGLYGRRVIQESETGADSYQLTPQLAPVRIPSDLATIASEIATETVGAIQDKIYSKGLTPSADAEKVVTVERKLGDTTLNNYMTKFLEIRPIARSLQYAQAMSGFLLETLAVSVHEGYYTKSVEIVEPITNTILYLFPSELLALYHYAIQKSMGIENDTIPTQFSLHRSFSTQIKPVTNKITYQGETWVVSAQIDAATYLAGLSYDTNIQTPQEFSTMASNLWLRYLDHMVEDQDTALDKKAVMLAYMNSRCHDPRTIIMDLVPGFTTYSRWLGINGLDIADAVLTQYPSQTDAPTAWGNLADTIITALIPLTPTMKKFGNFTLSDAGYIRLRQLFVQMCSYRVVFLESSRDSPEFTIGPKWSTHYGPMDIETFRHHVTAVSQHADDTVVSNSVSELNGGFIAEPTVHHVSAMPYANQNISISSNNSMTQSPISGVGINIMRAPLFTTW